MGGPVLTPTKLRMRIIGREPADTQKILRALVDSLSSLEPSRIVTSKSWAIASFDDALVAAQVEAYTLAPGAGLRIECIVELQGAPSRIAVLADGIRSSLENAGYPVLLDLGHQGGEGGPRLV